MVTIPRKKKQPVIPAHGGVRDGAGRKPQHEDGAATALLSVRVRADQKEKVMALGGSEWIRQIIDLYADHYLK